MKVISIISFCFLVLASSFMLLRPATPVDSHFVWLDWDANAPSENVLYYTLYLGESSSPQSKIELGYQTSIQVIRNHIHTYAAVTASNQFGESPRSNEVYIISP